MYNFSAWKLALVLTVLLFSILYLLPTPNQSYDKLYGYLPLWMQERLPAFDVTDDHTLKISLQETDEVRYPEGMNYRKVVNQLSDILRSQLNEIGLSEEEEDYIFEEVMKPVRKFRLRNDYYLNRDLRTKTVRETNEKKE